MSHFKSGMDACGSNVRYVVMPTLHNQNSSKFKQNKKKIILLQYISGYLLSIWVAFCEVQGQEIVANAKKVAWPTIVFNNDLYYLVNSLFPRPTSEGCWF